MVSTTTAADASRAGLEFEQQPDDQQHHAEAEPDRGKRVLLGIGRPAGGQRRPMIEPHHLKGEIAERERDRYGG